ncbi:MAG: DUF4190 domain-containing protein [Chitinophagaceae bacterium]|jgi:hypothetical protein|nr:DUF4190 domain-containing protein [Chitinophagaceae bacterium]
MRSKILLTIIPVFFFLFHTEAAIFIPDVANTSNSVINISSQTVDAPTTKSKGSKKAKKSRAEKVDKVDKFAKWGFISAIAGFVSLFLLPVVTFALFPLAIGLSIAGLNSVKKNNTRGKGLAIAGLSLGSAGVLLLLFGLILVLSFLSAMN